MTQAPLKIAVFYHLPPGGAKRAVFNFTRALVRRGHTVDSFTFDTFPDELFSLKPIVRQAHVRTLPRWKSLAKLRPYLLKVYVNAFGKGMFFRALNRSYAALAREIDAGGYDVVFVHNCVYTQAPFLLRHLRTTSVYYAHEPLRWIYEPGLDMEPEPEGWRKRVVHALRQPAHTFYRWLSKTADRKNILSAAHVLANSHYTRESVYKAYGILPHVSRLGVEADHFRPLGLPRRHFVLSIGSIAPAKNHDFVIRALAGVDPALRPALVIVGNISSDDYVQELKTLAAASKVDLEIKLLISDEDLVRLYNEARAVVYPPLMEPFGLVPLEAMACGTPVIGVKEGGIRETIIDEQTGLHIARDPHACAAALTRLLTDTDFARRLGEQARAHVVRVWTWEAAGEELEHHLQQALDDA